MASQRSRSRRAGVACVLAALSLSGCSADEREGAGVPDSLYVATAGGPSGVHGVVRDGATDRPIAGVLVLAGGRGTRTAEDGTYSLSPLPASEVTVRAHRRGYVGDSVTVEGLSGAMVDVDLSLVPADAPCCELSGSWSVRFLLDSAGLAGRPTSRELTGRLSFESIADPDDGRVAAAKGESALDFGPLLGAGEAVRVGELQGVAFHGDSVAVTLLPRFGDWAIELLGRRAADTIRGDWYQRASCCGAYGRFEFVRAEP